jgi:CRISPR/Cas system CMR-associated protein Cmr5 small subunit
MRQNGVRSNVRFPYSKSKSAKKQGYAAREDESLGMRTGAESTKTQSMKDRRDESYGAWGKRTSGKVNV